MFDLTALGEVLIDFTSCGKSENNMRIFEQNPGGAPANVVCSVSKLGLKTAFIGKVGKDMHGEFLKSTLIDNFVNVDGLIMDPNYFTTLAFVELSDKGERSFSFARKPGADTQLEIADLNMEVILNSYIFHVGSLSLTDEPSRSSTIYALNKAKENNIIISYDPNYRELLWNSVNDAKEQMKSILPYVDIIKISDEETGLLTECSDPIAASKELTEKGISLVIVTLGSKGALLRTNDGYRIVPSVATKVVDTTGAGDSFLGGYLYNLAKYRIHPKDISIDRAAEFAKFSNVVASICIERRGAINAMPDIAEVNERLNSI